MMPEYETKQTHSLKASEDSYAVTSQGAYNCQYKFWLTQDTQYTEQ